MIFIYGFVAFLFFKIFPEFAGYQSNTVIGALVMAVVSAMILKAGEFAASWRIGVWLQGTPSDTNPYRRGLLLVAGAALLASVGSTFLVGIGFSDGLMRSAFKGFRADPLLFWVMAALPPILHVGLLAPRFWAAANLYREARKETDLKL
jgi:hypothetical protein